jgi:hypothetical protein
MGKTNACRPNSPHGHRERQRYGPHRLLRQCRIDCSTGPSMGAAMGAGMGTAMDAAMDAAMGRRQPSLIHFYPII